MSDVFVAYKLVRFEDFGSGVKVLLKFRDYIYVNGQHKLEAQNR